MDLVNVLREQVKDARELLEGTIEDVTDEQARMAPPGEAMPIVAHYAHIVMSEDMAVQTLLKGGAPLFASEWAGRTGLSGQPPIGPMPWDAAVRNGQIEFGSLRAYARAVHAATDAYLDAADDTQLSRTIDLSQFGIGEKTGAWILQTGAVTNTNLHCGEISCLKGLAGARGYPPVAPPAGAATR